MTEKNNDAAGGLARPVGLVVMLSLALMINYIDRGSIATAAPLLRDELALTPSEIGWVLAVFYWSYAPMQPVMGWLADRVGPASILAVGLALWSVATAATGFAFGLVSLVALRLLMGVGEAAFYPSALSLLARNVPPTQRAGATATMQFGAVVGPALGTLAGGLIMKAYGWRAMFLVMGLLSMTWLLFWRGRVRAERAQHREKVRRAETGAAPASHGDDPPYWLILRQRALWGGMMGTFCSNYAFYFVFSWLPLYLFTERGLSITNMSLVTASFYAVDAASILVAGYLLDAWIRRGASFNRAYKTALGLSAAGVGICLIGSTLVSGLAAAFALLLTGVMDGLNSPSNPSVTQTFAGPWATGRWMGLQNAVGNVAGMTAPVVTGYLVQQSGHYTSALIVAGTVALCGLIAWLVVVPEVKPVDWSAERLRRGPTAVSAAG